MMCIVMNCSCVVYRHHDRMVEVSDCDTGKAISGARFKFSHAVPALHLPRTPDAVDVALGSGGEARVKLPAVTGWARVGDASTVLHASDIRNGGTFDLHILPEAGGVPSTARFKLVIRKPKKK